MNPTKTFAAAVLVLICLAPFPARADLSMTILSETYHATGYVWRNDYEWDEPGDEENPGGYHFVVPGEYQSYDVTTSTPPASGNVSVWADVPGGHLGARSLATRYDSPEGECFYLGVYPTRLGHVQFFPAIDQYAYASLEVQFQPGDWTSRLAITVEDNSMYTSGSGTLTGGGKSWPLYSGDYYEGFLWNPGHSIPVDTTQIYTLSMDLWGENGGGSLIVDFQPLAPLPGAALLGLLGLGCAGWRLRKTSLEAGRTS